MKVLVRSESRGGFYAGYGTWTLRPIEAFSFSNQTEAIAFCDRNHINDYDLHVKSRLGPEHDMIISKSHGVITSVVNAEPA